MASSKYAVLVSVFIYSAVTVIFLREVGRGMLGRQSELTFSVPVQLWPVLLSVA